MFILENIASTGSKLSATVIGDEVLVQKYPPNSCAITDMTSFSSNKSSKPG